MSKLISELQRLYAFPTQALCTSATEAGAKSDAETHQNGTARGVVLGLKKTSDWALVAKLYQGLQDDLGLPPLAMSISSQDGYQIWISLAEPVPQDQIDDFVSLLRQKYLSEIPADNLRVHPVLGDAQSASLKPCDQQSGRYSAFIDPTLGGLFADEPWLDIAPNRDQQANLLAELQSIKMEDWQNLLKQHVGHVKTPHSAAKPNKPQAQTNHQFSDPRSFLLAIMNDPNTTTNQRIKAAKALLPYVNNDR